MHILLALSRCSRLSLYRRGRALALLGILLLAGLFSLALPVCADAPAKKAAAGGGVNTAKRQQAAKLLQRANLLRSKGKNVDAELVLQDALKADPSWIDVYVARAKCYDALNSYENAANNWKTVVKMAPGNVGYKRSLARSAANALDWELAIENWLDLANMNQQDLEACNMLASIYLERGSLADAELWNNAALDLKPGDVRAQITKARIASRNRRYSEAIAIYKEAMNKLPADHPLMSECAEGLEAASRGERTHNWFMAALIGIPTLIVVLALLAYRHVQNMEKNEEPIFDAEAATEDSVCRYLLQFCRMKFDLPRGLCWSVSVDGRHYILQMSHLVGETSGVAQLSVDRNNLADWLEGRGTAPFLYEAELDDVNFQKAFSFLIKELAEVRIDVGVPVVRDKQLLALVLLGSSRSARQEKVRQRFSEHAEEVQKLSEKVSVLLERVIQRNRRVVDSTTGMWNREYYEESLANIYRGCRTAHIPMSLFMMRVDQVPPLLDKLSDDERADMLYSVGQMIMKGISGEMNVTLCHLDNGVFALIAPERDAKAAEKLAKDLKSSLEKGGLPGTDGRTTGCVAYCVAPDDGDDPSMLRSMVYRTFRELIYADGNAIKRVTKTDTNAPEGEESQPQEELIIRRVRHAPASGSQSTYQPFGKAKITSNADLGDLPESSNASRQTIKDTGKIVSLGMVKPMDVPKPKPAAAPLQNGVAGSSAPVPKPKAALSMAPRPEDREDEAEESKATPAAAASATPSKANEDASSTSYSLELKFDEDGVEIETQCCSQDVFEELISFELEQAKEAGEECALVYLRIANLEDIRSTGRSNYMKLRRELSSLMRAFLREDLDIPGLIGEDDFAVFMTGTDKNAAMSLADRLNLTSPNLDAGGYFMVPALGVTLVKCSDSIASKDLIAKARALADSKGIHCEKE
ncbi:diguanylate cyclase [bacterium]|nr:diguanylate cyclase [bacterium]